MSSAGITNCTSRHSALCTEEALKDTVGLGGDEWDGLGQRGARVSQIWVSTPGVSTSSVRSTWEARSTWKIAHQNVCTSVEVTRGPVRKYDWWRTGVIFRKPHARTNVNETSQSTNGALYFRQIFLKADPRLSSVTISRGGATNIRTLPWGKKEGK